MAKDSHKYVQSVQTMVATANKSKRTNITKLYNFCNEKQTRPNTK
jgi:hypothetical protein